MLNEAEVISILRDAVYTTIVCAAPMLIVALVVGLLISVFQATTQINEQTLAFVPKILGILLAILIFGGFILGNLSDFTTRLYESINTMLT